MHQAMFFKSFEGGQIECRLCPHYCHLSEGQTGLCQVRHNIAGSLFTSAYGQPVMIAVEPIEKKYLFHVSPGSQTLSLGTLGCNLRCKYCINWRVSQIGDIDSRAEISPEQVIEHALTHKVNCIAFTYTEPAIFFEYAMEIAQLAHDAGLVVAAKSNGYMAPDVMRRMATWLDAINIDLKAWQASLHRQITGGEIVSVLDNLRLVKSLGLWLEVSTLIVPGVNDDPADLASIARFIADELGADTPWHVLRFFPNYQMESLPTTSQTRLALAIEQGQHAGLHYIYAKDFSLEMLHTHCPQCHKVVIQRERFGVVHSNLVSGRCGACNYPIAGLERHDKSLPISESAVCEANAC